ncbi:MAG: sigma-70 family RNA polymerase sigma factor [Phycisphaerales bacterium]
MPGHLNDGKPMLDKDQTEQFVGLMLQVQPRLYGYIMSLIADPSAAQDILQETNLVIWRKSEEFEFGTNFTAWVYRIALFQVKAARKRMMRDRLIFSDELVHILASEAESGLDDLQDRMRLLRKCMNLLSLKQQGLLEQRYTLGRTVGEIALELGRPIASIHQTLYRIRLALIECVGRSGDDNAYQTP